MKIRFARNRKFTSHKAKGAAYGILLFMVAFAVPRFSLAQDKPTTSGSSQKSNPASIPKSVDARNAIKNVSRTASGETLSLGSVMGVEIAPEDSKATVTVTTDRLLAPQEFILDDPPRLVLDFPDTINRVQFTRRLIRAASVKRVRVQQYQSMPSPITRMVFDLEEGYGPHELTVDEDSIRLVFHKGQSKSNMAGSSPAAKSAPNHAENSAKSKTLEVPQSRTSPPEPLKTATNERKSHSSDSKKSPAAAVPASPEPRSQSSSRAELAKSPAAVNIPTRSSDKPTVKTHPAPIAPAVPPPVQGSPSESPKVAVANADPVPGPTDSMPNNSATPMPLVAALAPSAIPAPPKMAPTPNSHFAGQPLTLDLIDMPLVDFFRLMAEEGGINIVMDPGIKDRITFKATKLPWDQVFEAALANHGLDKQVEGTLVRIARKSTLQEEAKQQEALKKAKLLAADLETRIIRLNYAKASSLVNSLVDQKTVRGTVVVDDRTNALILTDIPSSIDRMVKLIETLDVSQPQVEIEARIVSATRDFARDIGIQFGFVQGNLQRVTVGGPNTFGTIGGTRPSATPTSTFAAGNPFTGRGASDDKLSEAASVSTGTSSVNAGNYNVNLPAKKPFGGVGISIGNIFDTFLLDAAITAGESKGLAKLISQPKVTAQNNSAAIITQGLRFPVQIIANNTISVQFQNAALTLTVTPQITYEGNIVLDLKVENNTPDFGRQVNGIPSIRTSESTTRVLVSDGGTTVIGGILIDNESSAEDKVPGLGSLPVVGNLFRRTSVERSTQEVLFFVTPRVIK